MNLFVTFGFVIFISSSVRRLQISVEFNFFLLLYCVGIFCPLLLLFLLQIPHMLHVVYWYKLKSNYYWDKHNQNQPIGEEMLEKEYEEADIMFKMGNLISFQCI